MNWFITLVLFWIIGIIPNYIMLATHDRELKLSLGDCRNLALMWPITWVLSYIGFFRANWR